MSGNTQKLTSRDPNIEQHRKTAFLRLLSLSPFFSSFSINIKNTVLGIKVRGRSPAENKMKPTNPNAHTYVNGTDVKTHGYAVTHNTFLQSFI
jgi:hypothetical protein